MPHSEVSVTLKASSQATLVSLLTALHSHMSLMHPSKEDTMLSVACELRTRQALEGISTSLQ